MADAGVHDDRVGGEPAQRADDGRVRIEDIVTVTPEGGRRLNNTGREMRIVS